MTKLIGALESSADGHQSGIRVSEEVSHDWFACVSKKMTMEIGVIRDGSRRS